MPGAERKNEPQQIVAIGNSLDIIMPHRNILLHLTYTPEGDVITRIVELTRSEQDRLATETEFTTTTRLLLVNSLEYKSAQAAPGSNEIGPELAVLDLEAPFKQGAVRLARHFDYSRIRVKELVTDQGKVLTSGQTHMGIMSPIVKEEVVKLHGIIDDLYQEIENPHPSRGRRRPSASF